MAFTLLPPELQRTAGCWCPSEANPQLLLGPQVPQWSRIGRLKRNTFPKLVGGGNVFGGGASPGAMTCIAGRLLCDTYLSCR